MAVCFKFEASSNHHGNEATMKAVRFHEYGDADVLRYEDIEQPVPGPDQVRIHVAATAFNPVDAGIRGGYLQEPFPVALPHVPGIDVAGTVDAVGANVTVRRVGDRVIAFLPMLADGSAAEYVLAPAEILAEAPASLPLTDAAALPSVGLTAWQSLFEHAELRAGQRLLVNGAGGAVGGYTVQLAKRAGAHVIATASPRSTEAVRRAGADEIIDRTTTTVLDAVSPPIDVILNLAPIDPAELTALAGLLRAGGIVLSTVPTAVPAQTPDVRAVPVFARSDAGQLAELVRMIDAGELHVDIAERLALSELPAVHARADAGALPGKVVLLPPAA
jgi:NADPH:quinone reductase-like Zn-dependent oxidoreductase